MKIPANHIAKGLILTVEPVNDDFTCEILADALENGESKYQIGEGQFYDYEFSDKSYGFAKSVTIEFFRKQKNVGRISPNIYVGTLSLDVVHIESDSLAGQIEIEVRSVKSEYRSDYRRMMEEITEQCFDLILQMNVPVKQTLTTDFGEDSRTGYQRFAFVRSIVDSEGFNEAIHRIISAPTTQWTENEETTDLRHVSRVNRGVVKQIISNNNRSPVSSGHYLHEQGLSTIPQRVTLKSKTDSVDTPENRFVKHMLEVFLHFIMEFERSVHPDTREAKEAKNLSDRLEEYLAYNLFKSISRPTSLRLNSPVLQRKEGYREILRSWVMFDLAAKLIWSGGDDVYQAGKKDIATLYEYWLFFKLLQLFGEIFKLKTDDLSQLIVSTKYNLGLQLKQGRHVALQGIYNGDNRRLNVRFSYNRSFSGSSTYPNKGSWTKTMRPDYTLSIWPGSIDEDSAEEQELITHVHFDAKYKIENFINLIRNSDSDNEKEDEARGKYKNADLLKMHAYRDAIRRTSGAYVLYPGAEIYRREGFHEILPGLGAFPIRPSVNDSGISVLKGFIIEIIDNLTNRASQKEQADIRKYFIYRDKPTDELHEPLPENYGLNRDLHPLNTFVNVCFSRGPEHTQWIKKELVYNARINSRSGSIKVSKELAGAKYILIREKKFMVSNLLYEVKENESRVYTRDELINKMNYPNHGNPQDAYLLFKLTQVELKEFGNISWDLRLLDGYKSGWDSVFPFTTSLQTLMKAKV